MGGQGSDLADQRSQLFGITGRVLLDQQSTLLKNAIDFLIATSETFVTHPYAPAVCRGTDRHNLERFSNAAASSAR